MTRFATASPTAIPFDLRRAVGNRREGRRVRRIDDRGLLRRQVVLEDPVRRRRDRRLGRGVIGRIDVDREWLVSALDRHHRVVDRDRDVREDHVALRRGQAGSGECLLSRRVPARDERVRRAGSRGLRAARRRSTERERDRSQHPPTRGRPTGSFLESNASLLLSFPCSLIRTRLGMRRTARLRWRQATSGAVGRRASRGLAPAPSGWWPLESRIGRARPVGRAETGDARRVARPRRGCID